MRARKLTTTVNRTKGFISPGGTVTGPLFLSGAPTTPDEAACKVYVDTSLSTLAASDFTTGIIPVARLPALSGDFKTAKGGNTATLQVASVTAGTYPKVTVNAKGFVTNGFGLVASDIPGISFTKLAFNKPTTVGGYGITDALLQSGGVLNGNLTVSSPPTDLDDLVNLQYLEQRVSQYAVFRTGDMVMRRGDYSGAGFLKCNGAEVLKTDYPNLYTVVGDQFSVALTPVTKFKLPDMTSYVGPGTGYFIKT